MEMKILYYDEDVIIAEDQSREKIIFYPYCRCNSGLWWLEVKKLTKNTFDSLQIKLKNKLKTLNFEPK